MLHVEVDGEVVHVGAAVPIQEDRVPSRREVETAFMSLRAKHGHTSAKEIDTLYRAYTHIIPTKEIHNV
jgi:hypothetical protein